MRRMIAVGLLAVCVTPLAGGCRKCACSEGAYMPAPASAALAPEVCQGGTCAGDEEVSSESGEAAPEPPSEMAAEGAQDEVGHPYLLRGPLSPVPPSAFSGLGSQIRDPRRVRRPRSQQLLEVECQGLKRLFATTPRTSPDRPQILRRLAEGYSELAAAAAGNAGVEITARLRAISRYQQYAQDYPNLPGTDEVLYYLALAYERAGNGNASRQAYFEIIQRMPTSPHVPLAHLAFGELLFQEALADSTKWVLAAAAYGRVVKYPAPANQAECYAHYRAGLVQKQLGQQPRAQQALAQALVCASSHPKLPESREIRIAATKAQRHP